MKSTLVSVWKRFWIFCQILNSTNSCTVLFLKCLCHNGPFSFCRFFPAFIVCSWCEFVEKMVEIFVKENRDYLNDHYVPLSSSVVLTTNSYLIEFLYMILIWLVFVWYIVLFVIASYIGFFSIMQGKITCFFFFLFFASFLVAGDWSESFWCFVPLVEHLGHNPNQLVMLRCFFISHTTFKMSYFTCKDQE